MRKSKASDTAILAIFIAIMVVLQIFNQLVVSAWPFPIRPTLLHIPVIIASITLGWRKGAFVGFVWGAISFITATIITTPTSFIFSALQPVPGTNHGSLLAILIAFVPRILVGILPYFVYQIGKNRLSSGFAAFVGAATNTILVLGGMYVFFGHILKWSLAVLLQTIVATNSVVEVIIAIILTAAIVPALQKSRGK